MTHAGETEVVVVPYGNDELVASVSARTLSLPIQLRPVRTRWER